MNILAETERLILREIDFCDEKDMFEMDSDPDVHLYIEQQPVTTMDEITKVIGILRNQYKENGIARWAVIEKDTGEFVGWSGLKFFREPLNNHVNFYEHGYRFKKKHWGKGFATESSIAIIEYGFQQFKIDSIYAITDPLNANSIKVLNKLGFIQKEPFDYDGDLTNWFELKKIDWEKKFQ